MPTTKDRRPATRIGHGFDSHEFRPCIPLKIGGIALAHDKGLGGHSDGDVLLHALTDALLGAIAAPDIGSLFPPSEAKWKGADSVIFLREALKRMQDAGYGVANVDACLILAAPKIGPHAAAIRGRVAELLGVHTDCVGLKAKTPEGLNSQDAAVAHVVVLLEKVKPGRKQSGRRAPLVSRRALVSIVAVCLFLCGNLRAQDESERTFGQIYKYLTRDLKSRYFANPLLFVGEITALGPVFKGVCKEAVNQTVDFAVSELLLGGPC